MLSEEEKEALLIFNNIECNRLSDTENKAIVIISNLIEQLESDKQELIEKLDKDIINITKILQDGKHSDDYSRCRLKAYRTKTKEILKILKGENE